MSVEDRYCKAVNSQDWMAVADLLHEDYEGYFPQSGELIKGPDAYRAVYSRYEGGIPETTDLASSNPTKPDVEVIRPVASALPIITVSGASDEFNVVGRATYSNGQSGFVIGFVKLAQGKIIKETIYFAEDFAPLEWRSDLVEVVDR